MSVPIFPDTADLTRENVINQIISSIAMEELGLSHIVNAEGEKLQYALGTIPGVTGPEGPLTLDELLKLNESIQATLNSTMMNQFFLKEKLSTALSSPVMRGPTGATGPTGAPGPVTVDVHTDVISLPPGAPPTVENLGTEQEVILQFGIPQGATGPNGPTGATGPAGTAQISGMQAVLSVTGSTGTQILNGEAVPFNEAVFSSGSDITFDDATGLFTIQPSGLNMVYQIHWWVFAEGAEAVNPITLSLNVGTASFVTVAPRTEMQLSGFSLVAVTGVDPVTISLVNASEETIELSSVALQAQISLIGFKPVS